MSIGMGARERREDTEAQRAARIQKISVAVRTILECIGEDPDREGLLKTPERYAKALMFFSKGYEESVTRKLAGWLLCCCDTDVCFCPFLFMSHRKLTSFVCLLMLLFRPYEQGALPGGYGLLARMLHGKFNSTTTDVVKTWRKGCMDNVSEVLTPGLR